MTGPKRPGPPGKEPAARSTARHWSPARARATAASASLYERYKDALRRGHVAALRGRHDAAIDAYGEAASIAPDRALPHASVAGILAKMNRPADSVAAYRRALELAPRDETALRGIAEVLTRLGRRAEAADALDRLAEGLDAAGRLPDATDTARRALELAESRPRRTQLEALVERLRDSAPEDAAAQAALAGALAVLGSAARDGDAPSTDAAAEPPPDAGAVAGATIAPPGAADDAAASDISAVGPDLAVVTEPPIDTGGVAGPAAPVGPQAALGPDEATAVGPDLVAEPAPAEPEMVDPEMVEPAVAEPAGLGIALGAVAEAQLHAGQLDEAREGLLAAARAHRRAGRLVAAVDACDLAIAVAPADPDLHLLLAELYLDRGWRTLATEKLLLLGRIADLDADTATRERLCGIVAARLGDEPRLTEICA